MSALDNPATRLEASLIRDRAASNAAPAEASIVTTLITGQKDMMIAERGEIEGGTQRLDGPRVVRWESPPRDNNTRAVLQGSARAERSRVWGAADPT